MAKRDVEGTGLALLNRFAGSKMAARLGLHKPAQQAIYQASKASFKVAGMAGRQFKAVRGKFAPARMSAGASRSLFDLSLSEEQEMIVESVRRFALDRLRPATADAEAHQEVSETVWNEAFELGLGAMAVPESLGGAGSERSPVTNALVAEALGWGDMGQAAALLAPIGVANVLAAYGNGEQQARYLGAFAQDDPPDAALALLEPQALADPAKPACHGKKKDDAWLLCGEKALVPLGPFADILVVSAHLEELGPRLILLQGDSAGLSVTAQPAMGLRGASLGRILFQDVAISAESIIGDENSLSECIALSRLAWCALAVGAAQAVLDYVIPYVNERHAFGEPVSHRQGVAFEVSRIGIELAGMRMLVWRAAARAEQGLAFQREAALAHRFCADKAMQIGSAGVQLLGGHGYVKEHPVERWYRDLRAIGMMEGGLLL